MLKTFADDMGWQMIRKMKVKVMGRAGWLSRLQGKSKFQQSNFKTNFN